MNSTRQRLAAIERGDIEPTARDLITMREEAPFRFPDKPTRASAAALPDLQDGQWLAQAKPDGFRAVIQWDGSFPRLTSRHEKPIPISHGLLTELSEALRGVLPNSTIDGEWMGRRDGQPEGLWLFDLIEDEGCWIGHHGALCRFNTLRQSVRPSARVRIVPFTLTDYGAFFEHSKTIPGVEGIVLKRTDSKYIGSTRSSVDNPQWMKIKWREGADGQVRVA